MTVTKVLQEQSGIQYGGPQDKSEVDPRDSLLNIVFTGRFKRGRFDKPFKVTKANYRAKLGFDPDNKDYVAVEDALADGAPYVWVQRIQGGQGNGKMVAIDAKELQYPSINSFVAFTVPSSSYRFSINVETEDITGTLADVMAKLADDYGILTTYTAENQVIFTASREIDYLVAITGVTPAPKDQSNYLINHATNPWSDGYCEVLAQPNNIYTFSMATKRQGSWVPMDVQLDLDTQHEVKVSNTAKAIDTGNYAITNVMLNPWADGVGETITNSTQMTFNSPSETIPFSQVIANRNTDSRYMHEYQTIAKSTFTHNISRAMALANQVEPDLKPLVYSSNLNTMFAKLPVYMDFSKSIAYKPFLKGYVPYLEVGM